jgi:hypothetical protein
MNLIERTNKDNLQTYVISKGNQEKDLNLVRANLLQRLIRSLKTCGVSPQEFEDKLSPKLCIRVIKVTNNEGSSQDPLLIGNLNIPNTPQEDSLPENTIKVFKNSGIDLPREKLLSERLRELNFSSEDPFRLHNVHTEEVYTLNLNEISYSDLEDYQEEFYETLYSETSFSLGDQLTATYIVSVDKIFNTDPERFKTLNQVGINKLVADIDDAKLKERIKKEISLYVNQPRERPRLLEKHTRVLKGKSKESTPSKPIKTWKIALTCSILIFSILAYTKRDAIKLAFKVSGEAKDFERSKFSIFIRTLFSGSFRGEMKDYMKHSRGISNANKILDPTYLNKLKADRDHSETLIEAIKRRVNGGSKKNT